MASRANGYGGCIASLHYYVRGRRNVRLPLKITIGQELCWLGLCGPMPIAGQQLLVIVLPFLPIMMTRTAQRMIYTNLALKLPR